MVFVYVTLGTLAGIFGIPYSLVVGNIRLLYRVVVRGIMPLGLRAGGIRVEVSGLDHIPAGVSCIFLSNHVSNLDPPVLLPVLPGQCSVLLKKGLMRIPLLGTAMRLGKFVPVERGQRREAAQASVAAAQAALRSRAARSVLCRGNALGGRAAGGVQERAVLHGDGDGRADCAHRHLRDREDDAQAQREGDAGSGEGAGAAGDRSGGIRDAG